MREEVSPSSRRRANAVYVSNPKNKGSLSNELMMSGTGFNEHSNSSNIQPDKKEKNAWDDFVIIDEKGLVGIPKPPKWKGQINPITKQSKGNRIRTAIARGVGGYVIRPLISWHIGMGESKNATNREKSEVEEKFDSPDVQESINHETIPGWNGEKFDPGKNTGKDILNDFRRIPTVWARMTAGKAVNEETIGEGDDRRKEDWQGNMRVPIDIF